MLILHEARRAWNQCIKKPQPGVCVCVYVCVFNYVVYRNSYGSDLPSSREKRNNFLPNQGKGLGTGVLSGNWEKFLTPPQPIEFYILRSICGLSLIVGVGNGSPFLN